jgi:hypothetical protein
VDIATGETAPFRGDIRAFEGQRIDDHTVIFDNEGPLLVSR